MESYSDKISQFSVFHYKDHENYLASVFNYFSRSYTNILYDIVAFLPEASLLTRCNKLYHSGVGLLYSRNLETIKVEVVSFQRVKLYYLRNIQVSLIQRCSHFSVLE